MKACIPKEFTSSTKNSRRVAWAYFFPIGETVEGEMLHIHWLRSVQDKLRHPLADDGGEFEAPHTDRKILSSMVLLSWSAFITLRHLFTQALMVFFTAHACTLLGFTTFGKSPANLGSYLSYYYGY